MKPDYKDDPFFQYPTTHVNTRMGDVSLPMHFYDASNVISVFKANDQGVEALLEGTGLQSALRAGNCPLVFLSFYEYRHTGVGPYNEVGVAIPVVRKGCHQPRNSFFDLLAKIDNSHVGYHIVNLPVTTEEADSAGKEIWGYPKFVTDIPFSLDKGKFSSEVKDPVNGSIACLSGNLNLGIKSPCLSGVTYSHLDGDILRSAVNARGSYRVHPFHNLRLSMGNSDHEMAKNLNALGLHNQRPITVLSCTNFQSRLNAGAVVSCANS